MTDRRQLLQVGLITAAGVAVLPGCSSTPNSEPRTPATPDAQQADEIALVVAYDAAIAAGGNNVEVLTRIRDDHAEHLRGLGWQAGTPEPSPGEEAPGRAALVRAERQAARRRADGARDAADAEQAQILALIAASESQHVVILESL